MKHRLRLYSIGVSQKAPRKERKMRPNETPVSAYAAIASVVTIVRLLSAAELLRSKLHYRFNLHSLATAITVRAFQSRGSHPGLPRFHLRDLEYCKNPYYGNHCNFTCALLAYRRHCGITNVVTWNKKAGWAPVATHIPGNSSSSMMVCDRYFIRNKD